MSQVTTITFFKYSTFLSKLWAFGMMQFAHAYLKRTDGLVFYKLLGSGKEGFNPFPDWSVYALLQIWTNEEYADDFHANSNLMKKYLVNSRERWTLFLKNTKARGVWDAKNPFIKHNAISKENTTVVVITRATIKTKHLLKFWRYVPTSQNPLAANKGLLYTKGIGEVPFTQMATFSIWKDEKSLFDFAYNSKEHAEAIKKTKKIDWYSEELFSRFQPYKEIGSWEANESPIC